MGKENIKKPFMILVEILLHNEKVHIIVSFYTIYCFI